METSFFSGSENLYKYLVTVGTLLVALTVYYPLKEKQDLEVLSLKIKNELQVLNCQLEDNKQSLDNFKKINNNKTVSIQTRQKAFNKIKEINQVNKIKQISIETKYDELKCRKSYINIYNIVFWIFCPLGVILIVYGFVKWNKVKRIDDKILELEKRKLELQVQELQANTPTNSSTATPAPQSL